MSWLSRALLGLIVGVIFRSPFLGLLIALAWNNSENSKQKTFTFNSFSSQQWNNIAYAKYHDIRWINGCFSALAAFAHLKGVVTENDIKFASALMTKWEYTDTMRKQAIEAFRNGKVNDHSVILNKLLEAPYWTNKMICQELLTLLHRYLQSNSITQTQARVFQEWFQRLTGTQYNYQSHSSSNSKSHRQSQRETVSDLHWAYKQLGVQSHDDYSTVKIAFRRKISASHPDRNHSKEATSKTQDLQKAYSIIKKEKGW